MNDIWTVTPVEGGARVVSSLGNSLGGEMPEADAKEIADVHNQGNDPQWLQNFGDECADFFQTKLSKILNEEDDAKAGNYWRLVSSLLAVVRAQLKSAVDNGLVKLKPQ